MPSMRVTTRLQMRPPNFQLSTTCTDQASFTTFAVLMPKNEHFSTFMRSPLPLSGAVLARGERGCTFRPDRATRLDAEHTNVTAA